MRKGKTLSTISWLIFVLAILTLLSCIMFSKIEVSGVSMNPTLKSGEYGITDNFTYRIFGVHRFDIITIELDDKTIVKRVVGLPGEKLYYDVDGLHVDGHLIEEDFIDESMIKKTITNTPLCTTGVTLGEDEYYVLGDNRSNSTDSRYIGPIKAEQIKSRGFIIYGDTGSRFRLPRFIGW